MNFLNSKLISGVMLSLALVAPTKVLAWGHLKDMATLWGPSHLIQKVLAQPRISYCIEMMDPNYSEESIDTQVKMALHLWLKPLEDDGLSPVQLTREDCSQNQFDLKIAVGPDALHPNIGSYEQQLNDRGRHYSFIQFNTSYVYTDPNTKNNYPKIDFQKIVPSGQSLPDFLNSISIEQPTTPYLLSAQLGLDYIEVYEGSYRSFLHEMGHAFGLCDLYLPANQTNCDSQHLSTPLDQAQPESLMNSSEFYYLTNDDVAGIRSLAERFR